MIIKVKQDKVIKVDVLGIYCPTFKCFSPHYYQHKSKSIDGCNKDWKNNYLSCSYRDFHGCPEYPKKREL